MDKCIYFTLEKERYTPYTTFKGSFIIPQNYDEIYSIKFFIDDTVVHHGSVDMAKMVFKEGFYRLDISSRSYTLALGVNQPKPQINSSVSLKSIITTNMTFNFITYENDTKTIDYIYLLENSTLWDAIVAYSLKAYNKYPYIYKTNEVRINAPTNIQSRTYNQNNIIEMYNCSTLSNMLSHVHMKDSEGNYEKYNYISGYAILRNIVRHKQIPLDMQWLSNTNMALISRSNYSRRGCKQNGIKVLGYSGEELFDQFTYTFENSTNEKCSIHKLNISGNNNVIYTTMYQYNDAYKNV